MIKYYANLLGVWTDITNSTVMDHQPTVTFFEEELRYINGSNFAECFKFDYINVQHENRNYRIHPSMIQIVTE